MAVETEVDKGSGPTTEVVVSKCHAEEFVWVLTGPPAFDPGIRGDALDFKKRVVRALNSCISDATARGVRVSQHEFGELYMLCVRLCSHAPPNNCTKQLHKLYCDLLERYAERTHHHPKCWTKVSMFAQSVFQFLDVYHTKRIGVHTAEQVNLALAAGIKNHRRKYAAFHAIKKTEVAASGKRKRV